MLGGVCHLVNGGGIHGEALQDRQGMGSRGGHPAEKSVLEDLRGVPADLGAGWFEGLASRNRYALIARLSLWRHLDGYISDLDDKEFRRALVFLRRAFADFSPAEKNDIAENLGEIWGVNPQQAAEVLMNDLTGAEQEALSGLDEFDFDDI